MRITKTKNSNRSSEISKTGAFKKTGSVKKTGTFRKTGTRKAIVSVLGLMLATVLLLSPSSFLSAIIVDFGGASEAFSGGGDKVPPECQANIPTAATEPFFIQWNCVDNDAMPGQIRSQLWILRNGGDRERLIGSFLGFPASVFIDASVLGVEEDEFTEGLPVSFRLVAEDTAGITTVSPFFVVSRQDNDVDFCNLSIVTDATESTGSQTGMPSLTVTVTDAAVNAQEISDETIRVFSPSNSPASPCEIDDVCSNSSLVTFDSSLTITADGIASGTLLVSPGSVSLDVTGTGQVNDAVLDQLEVSGTTAIDGANATVTLTCAQQ